MKNFSVLFLYVWTFGIMINAQDDPYIWLEKVDGESAMEFVHQQNQSTFDRLSKEVEYDQIYQKSLEILNATDKIAYPAIYGEFIYNFWQDKNHVRGIWRRTTKEKYLTGHPDWKTLIDLDELSEKDDIKWVYKGVSGNHPTYDRFLVHLSKGGGDETMIREFDVNKNVFVEGGFSLDDSKGSASYIDDNTLIVSRNFGKNTMTTSGYPKQVKIWKRGTPLDEAKLIFEGKETDVGSWGTIIRDNGKQYLAISQAVTFFTSNTFVMYQDKLIELNIPEDCQIHTVLNDQLVLDLKSDWLVDEVNYTQGSLISLNISDLLEGRKKIQLIYRPDEKSSISQVSSTKNKLLVNLLNNVRNELYVYSYMDRKWSNEKVSAPEFGTISIGSTDELSDQYFFTFTNFLTPTTLFAANALNNSFTPYQSLPAYFDGSKYQVNQYHASSKDGILIPYFVIASNTLSANGNNPTLLNAYGGFEVASQPYYSGMMGNAWLDHGGVFVLANIRGGGEFGPKWHQAGLKEKRQNVYDDFHAVAEDLIANNITSKEHLGIMGGSNGGLLVGVAFTQRPDLYHAVVCMVPLLDMKRYNKLLSGASWIGEYGDPDKPEEWEFIKKYSPYQNLKAGVNYPEVFFYTSTRDDRVHPGHARKMAAKMIDMGYPVLYYENIEGGHAGSSTNEQRATMDALRYSYLLMKLK